MRFDRLPEAVGLVERDLGDLRAYPQVLRGSPAYVASLGHARLTRLVDMLAAFLRKRWSFISVDSRLSMLMPGMYPCIPGWHCDEFYRPGGGQPDLATAPECEHVMVVIGGCSLTRFVAEAFEMPLPTPDDLRDGRTVCGVMHHRIEQAGLATLQVQSGEVWRFSQISWHRGEAATEPGWRYFLRLTGSEHWTPVNQRRTQTQVYLTAPFEGW